MVTLSNNLKKVGFMDLFMKKLGVSLASVAILATWFVAPNAISSGRDCDTNAVLQCGATSTTELANKINGGATGPNQSAAELKALYGHYGISTADFGKLKTGWVQKNGEVWVDHKRVFTNAQSMGRHYIPGSTKVSFVSYPLYLRPTSVSFNSNSLESFVYLNDDGSMAYAIIKSCGNIVPGNGIKRQALYRGFARKFNDVNENGRLDSGETRISGVRFTLTGNGQNQSAVSDSNGYAGFWNLPAGRYTITETVPAGWHATTRTSNTLVVDGDRRFVDFGNARNRTPETQIRIVKFNDSNADKSQNDGEQLLAGWSFRVVGNGFDRTVTTDASGQSVITGLQPGVYTVTEINQNGWENTTGLSIQRTVTTDPATQTFVFGNRKVGETPVTPGGGDVPLPESGPEDAASAAGATTSMIGAAIAWIKSKKNFLASLKK